MSVKTELIHALLPDFYMSIVCPIHLQQAAYRILGLLDARYTCCYAVSLDETVSFKVV